jgi:hypothetical protein
MTIWYWVKQLSLMKAGCFNLLQGNIWKPETFDIAQSEGVL